jgi:hypothetical protein
MHCGDGLEGQDQTILSSHNRLSHGPINPPNQTYGLTCLDPRSRLEEGFKKAAGISVDFPPKRQIAPRFDGRRKPGRRPHVVQQPFAAALRAVAVECSVTDQCGEAGRCKLLKLADWSWEWWRYNMPRISRIDAGDALHHIMVRGIERGR